MSFEFVAGNLALDFVATVAERTTTHLEQLQTGADLADWIVQARLLDTPPAVDEGDLAAAKQLREALFRLVTALTEQAPLPEADRLLVNRFAAVAAPPTLSVTPDGQIRRGGDVTSALAVLARAGIELFDHPDTHLVRWCADARCTRPFIDRSRGHRRRWCGMAGCGDRAKAATYRQRQRQRRQGASPTPSTPQGSSRANRL
jgi:predicted RNA-binding Zn ribbon-like protein